MKNHSTKKLNHCILEDRTVFTKINEPVNVRGNRATYADERYGTHPRNSFDIWLSESETPTPLVVYIHGGGFIGGDKSKYFESPDLVRFLDAGVSVATINYRFMNEAPYGIKACFSDAKRCVQYLRYHAGKYNIDKTRLACSGGSAGAGIALWLAFSDEMADPENADPVLRESTRLTCAGAFATQATYDIFQWEDLIGVPIANTSQQLQAIALAFGFPHRDGIDLPAQKEIRKELDLLKMIDKDDAPIFVFNKHKNGIPASEDELNHHPLHAKALKEKAEEAGLEAVVYAPEIGIIDPSGKDLVAFFLEKLH
jgi:hypothetical protein